jgi:hypothetical protein
VKRASFLVAVALVATTTGLARADEGDLLPLPAADPPDPRGPEPPVMVVSPPPPVAGEPAAAPAVEPRVVSKLLDGGGEITLGTLFFRPSLGNAVFGGEGTPLGGTQRESFRHRGRELGIDAPLMWGGELSARYMRRYFAVGVMGFIAGHPGGAASTVPSYSPAADQVNPGALMGYGGGIDLAGALPLGPVAFRGGAVLGLRGFSLPMTGFEKKECHGKGGRTYPCDEDATTGALVFLEPRVGVELSPGNSGVVFGGYVGMGVVGGAAPTMGLFIGVATPHEKLQP